MAPHHALVISPHATWKNRRPELVHDGFGFSNAASWGLGTEFGYHYWTNRNLQGIYLGPSGVFGFTSPPAPTDAHAYYGIAFDVGWQLVLANGFTFNAGGGLLVLASDPFATQVLPRALLGLGWSF